MPFIRFQLFPNSLLMTLLMAFCLLPSIVLGEESDEALGLFSAYQETSSSATRAPKPLSQTAENITIITAKEIEALNAHTLADVLESIPGIQVSMFGGPGSHAQIFIQGESPLHTRVLLDNVPLNDVSNVADIAMVPAQIIERIEIVKGTASSSWGLALGGVINVITKHPGQRPVGGSATASIGEHTTVDSSAELTGTSGRLGYYLSGQYLGSDGVLAERTVYSNNTYAKLTYDLPGQGQVWGTFLYKRSARVDNYTTLLDFKSNTDEHDLYATVGMSQPLTDQLSLELSGFYADRDNLLNVLPIINVGSFQELIKYRDKVNGAGAKLVWHGEQQLIVGGFEFEHDTYMGRDLLNQTTLYERNLDRYGFYLNDTINIGRLSVIPGIRLDKTAQGNQFSPSLGATLRLSDNNLLRAYTGRGYSFTSYESSWSIEKIWTAQVGVESSAVPYLWLKATFFRNETWNVQDARNIDVTIPEQRIALGTEVEARTVSVFNTSLGAGYTFVDTTRTSNGSEVNAIPRHTVQLALRYDDKTYRGVLTGRHVFWNPVPGFGGKSGGMIWDLHLGATLLKSENSSLELFFSGHNLFNGSQFADETQPNTGRWYEGGMRVHF